MKSLKDIAAGQQQSRPNYFDDAEKDRMIALIIELAEEVCVLRDAVDNAAQLAKVDIAATPDALDTYTVSEDLIAERLAQHQAWFEQLFAQLSEPD